MWVDLEVLTPTHVGSGSDISPIEYWIDDRFARIYMDGLFADPGFSTLMEAFIRNAASARYLGQHVPAALLARHIRYQIPISPEARQYLVQHQIVVKEQIKSAGRAFIPGSSLKGSLLSALANSMLGKEYGSSLKQKQEIEDCVRSQNGFKLLDMVIPNLKATGRDIGAKDRFFRWVDVSDSNLASPHESLRIFYSEVAGARKGGRLPILFEGLEPGSMWVFSLDAAAESRFTPEQMLQCADAFYRAVWKKSDVKETPPENGYLLRLGQGCSAWATSLLILAESTGMKYRLTPPKTRKLVDRHIPMGWVLLSASKSSGLREIPGAAHRRSRMPVECTEAPAGQSPPTVSKPQIAPAAPSPARKSRLSRAAAIEGTTYTPAGLLALVQRWMPSDKIGLERIIAGLDSLDEEQASAVASVMRDRLKQFGQWEKHPKRFDIECFITEG